MLGEPLADHDLVPLGITTSSPIISTITARLRRNAAVPHLISAAMFSRELKRIEAKNAGEPFGPFWDAIFGYATAAVMTSVASVEAYSNEVFLDRASLFPNVSEALWSQLWRVCERESILSKFEVLAGVAGASLSSGSSPYQNMALLVRLRNALTHFKPEWEHQKVEHAKLSKQLESRLKPSPFLPNESTLIPLQWATGANTEWSVNTVLNFAAEFEAATGLPPKFLKHLHQLVA